VGQFENRPLEKQIPRYARDDGARVNLIKLSHYRSSPLLTIVEIARNGANACAL
jgi:hypothetical protein